MDHHYSRVPEKLQTMQDDTTKLLSDLESMEDEDNEALPIRTTRGYIWRLPWFIVVLAASNLTTFFGTLDYAKGRYSQDIQSQVNAAYGGKIDRELTVRRFSPFNFTSSKYTDLPSASVDQAWTDLGVERPYYVLPRHMGPTFGLNNSHFWVPREFYGTEGYSVVPEMIHQIHCVNSLRKNLYYNHAYYAKQRVAEGRVVSERTMVAHLNHCVDALREKLLCSADIGVTAFLWRNPEGHTVPDFAREHKCYDHNSVIAWYMQHAAPVEGSEIKVAPPPDAVFHPVEEFFRR